jgi:large subunit ribosomal protein L10
MNREEKEKFVADLHSRLEKAQGTILIHYQGLNVENISILRNQLRNTDAEFQVVKNRLLKLACQGTDTELVKDHMQGPSAIVLTYEDLVSPAKVLVDFAKGFNQLRFKGGQISGKVIDEEAIKRLAELPGKEVLLAQVLAAMQAVPANFVRVLNGITGKLLNALKAIEQQKTAA